MDSSLEPAMNRWERWAHAPYSPPNGLTLRFALRKYTNNIQSNIPYKMNYMSSCSNIQKSQRMNPNNLCGFVHVLKLLLFYSAIILL